MLLAKARSDAAAYLRNLAVFYPRAPALAAAAEDYLKVAQSLEAGLRSAPFPGDGLAAPEPRQAVAAALRQALAAERQGIDRIERALRDMRFGA